MRPQGADKKSSAAQRGGPTVGQLPRHVGIIMDGNGRWAKRRGWERQRGHRAGAKAVRRVVRLARRLNIPYLTLFAFSTENWGRPREEVGALMDLLSEFIVREWREIMERDIRVVALGELRRVPEPVRRRLLQLIQASRHNRSMTMALALSYGAREEILRAVRRLYRRIQAGRLRPDGVSAEDFSRCLDSRGMPDPDLIIRTGGERRLSNFLLWQSAYAELVFCRKLWPDFMQADFRDALREYARRRRRFGLTDEQARGRS